MSSYLSPIINFLSSVKLTLSEALFGLLALVIGLLVAALKLQGSKLHETQIALLEATLNSQQAAFDTKIAASRQQYNDALKAYKNNK